MSLGTSFCVATPSVGGIGVGGRVAVSAPGHDESVTSYAAFLRGINLGPTNKVPMPKLRETAERLGYTHVRTYINSGNLLFGSDKRPATLERELAEAIRKDFGLSIDVVVRTKAQLEQILAANPYPDGDPSQVTVAFLVKEPRGDAAERLAAFAQPHEPFTIAGRDVYVHYGQGLGTSKLAEQFSKIIGVSSTVRNVRTVGKVVELFDREGLT